jgi:MoaA/NifB/PqqE/SkfB family radical SAM enzyme
MRIKRFTNPVVLSQYGRNALQAAAINFNRWRGVVHVPRSQNVLHLETVSTCNLDCVFCAYPKKTSPKVMMADGLFRDIVGQAQDMGYTHFHLTPCTGDVFMDRRLFNKLEFLEADPRNAGYSFFTNFTVPDADVIRQMTRLKKLSFIHISIYGHDRASFKAVTKSTDKVYDRLLANLDTLHAVLDDKSFAVEISVKSTRGGPHKKTELTKSLERFSRAGVDVRKSTALYNNWGGMVTREDLGGLDMELKGEEAVYKHGACRRLFDQIQVMATGIVNGCACRDAEATLRIGNLHETPLKQILSPHNEIYMQLIEEQQRGEFRSVCRSCDFYKSVYKPVIGRKRADFISIEEFKQHLDGRAALKRDIPSVA